MSIRHELQRLASVGIHLPDTIRHITPASEHGLAMDAASLAPTQITASNAGVPAFLLNWMDPKGIEILLTPNRAAEGFREVQKGDWTTETAMFRTVEAGGQVATYGDFSTDGMATSNTTYPARQSYMFQTWTEWGDRELAQAGAGYIDLAADKDRASVIVLDKFMNKSYLYGVAGLQNYGITNDPSLPAAEAGTVNYATASPEDIANDFVRMVGLLIAQSGGLIDGSEPMVFKTAPSVINDIRRTNIYGLNADKKIRESYPNLTYVGVPEYDTAAGRLGQLWVTEIEGQQTVECAYNVKMQAHAVERYSTNTRQKKSAGTFGAIVYRPFGVTQTLGL